MHYLNYCIGMKLYGLWLCDSTYIWYEVQVLTFWLQPTELDWRSILEAAWYILSRNGRHNGVCWRQASSASILFSNLLFCKLVISASFQVHHGFYSAYHNTSLRPGVLTAVKSAKEFYGNIPIIVTGHSMGGAMAAFCGLDLTVCTKDSPLFLRKIIVYMFWLAI